MPSPRDARSRRPSGTILPDHIVESLFPQRSSIDINYRHTIGAIPLPLPPSDNQPVHGVYHAGLDGNSATHLPETRSNYTSLWGRWGSSIHGMEDDGYSGDEEVHELKAHREMPMNQISIENLIKKHDAGIPLAPPPSADASRDLENNASRFKEQDQVSQKASTKRRTILWENDVVGWEGPNDPENPHNWPKSRKFTVTILYASLTFCITFASSIFSTATLVTAELYGVSTEVMTFGTSLVVFVSAPSLASSMSD